jgi:transcriptional regulator with XRE-family HTH domain
MQQKRAEKSSIAERLQKLRLEKQFTWEQLADMVGLTASMLYQVKRGERGLSDKALYRLEQAEITAGLRPPAVHETAASKSEDPSLDIWMQRLRRKLSALDPKSRERMLKVILQILDAQRKASSK